MLYHMFDKKSNSKEYDVFVFFGFLVSISLIKNKQIMNFSTNEREVKFLHENLPPRYPQHHELFTHIGFLLNE